MLNYKIVMGHEFEVKSSVTRSAEELYRWLLTAAVVAGGFLAVVAMRATGILVDSSVGKSGFTGVPNPQLIVPNIIQNFFR